MMFFPKMSKVAHARVGSESSDTQVPASRRSVRPCRRGFPPEALEALTSVQLSDAPALAGELVTFGNGCSH